MHKLYRNFDMTVACKQFSVLTFFFLIVIFSEITYSASSDNQVKWIGSIDGQSAQSNDSNIAARIFSFVFGKQETALIRPVAVACNGDNKLWILDHGLRTAANIDLNTTKMSFLPSYPEQTFPSPIQLCYGPRDQAYFTDSSLDKIFRIDNNGAAQIFTGAKELKQPSGIAWNPSGKLFFVAETGKHRILVLDESGNIINTIGQRGKARGQFNFPTYLWVDRQGLLYVVDSMNFRVQLFSETGKIISVFGTAGNSSGYMARPKGIATDSDGNIYLVDALFHTVQIFDRSGNYLHHFGQQGKGDAEFWLPGGIFIDNDDRIYVADSFNSRIQVFQYTSGMMDGR